MTLLTGDLSPLADAPTQVIAASSTQYFPVVVGVLASSVTLLLTIAAMVYGRDFLNWIRARLVGVGDDDGLGNGYVTPENHSIGRELLESGAEIDDDLPLSAFDHDAKIDAEYGRTHRT